MTAFPRGEGANGRRGIQRGRRADIHDIEVGHQKNVGEVLASPIGTAFLREFRRRPCRLSCAAATSMPSTIA
jgi:hypothetical protein